MCRGLPDCMDRVRPVIIMFDYTFFQSGFIFCSLFAGLFCLCHVLFGSGRLCRNSKLIGVVIATGLYHAVSCAYMIDLSQRSVVQQLSRGDAPDCTDFTLRSTVANAIVFAVISHYVIGRNLTSSLVTWLLEGIAIVCMFTGVVLLFAMDVHKSCSCHQEAFMTVLDESGSQTEMFLSLCLKKVSTEQAGLILEYALIYAPALIVVLVALYKSNRRSNKFSCWNLKLVEDSCSSELGHSCFCSKLNPAFVSIILYFFLLLFVIRPVSIMYSSMTSGTFRDVFPGLANTVLYCFLCGEYLLCFIRTSRSNNQYYHSDGTKSDGINLVQYV